MLTPRRAGLLLALSLLLTPPAAHAVELKISAQALERTLNQQLFNAPDGRYYIRGDNQSPCYVYVDQPKVSFSADRIIIHVHTHSRLGAKVRGACIGLGLSPEADVSVLPDAQGENIGFRDPRIDTLTESKELNIFLVPFLSRKLPQKMTVNMADLLRKLLTKSTEATGYDMKLDGLKIHSMQVSGDHLVVDFDGNLDVH